MMTISPSTIAFIRADLLDEFLARRLEIIGQSEPSHRLDESRAGIQAPSGQLSRFVVPGEDVVVVVPALAQREERHGPVVHCLHVSGV